jgi:signal transduction histidine kinase
MSATSKMFKVILDTFLRRLRNTPGYFFLIWRWSMWLYALTVIVGSNQYYKNSPVYTTCLYLLIVTLFQSLIVTFYAPIFQFFLPRINKKHILRYFHYKIRRARAEDEEPDITPPLPRTRNTYWDIAIYGLDVLICGLVMYYSGPFGIAPNFGVGSPFYRYGMSTAFAAAFAYRYKGGVAAAIGYDLFVILGALLPAPTAGSTYHPNIVDFLGSLVDTPLAAILAAYLASLLAQYTKSKRLVQENVRQQKALRTIGEIILRQSGDKQRLLQKSAEAIRTGGHFQRLVLALVTTPPNEDADKKIYAEKYTATAPLEIDTCIDIDISMSEPKLPARNEADLTKVMQSSAKWQAFEPLTATPDAQEKYARLYLPFFKDGQISLVLGVESLRRTPFDTKQEEFLSTAGNQLLIALDNIHLTEQTVQLAATAERTRIAREIHDGIAQIVYMLSLNAETCATQAHRIVEASEEDAELVTPLAERLDKLVTVSKQALWETRNYMFSLKPLMSGSTTLTQMLTNQLHEFETISDLPVHLAVKGAEQNSNGDKKAAYRQAQVGAAIFRIVQEALTNAYKHANATQLWVNLTYTPNDIEVDVYDNGCGLQAAHYSYDLSTNGDLQRIYSGHGLHGMRDRAEELGGTFALTEVSEGGVKVQAQIPI